jgi:hypothetical protein
MSFCKLSSAYIFFNRRFSSAPAARFQLFQAFHLGQLHTTLFCLPIVKRGFTDTVLACNLSDRLAAVLLFENRHDLRFSESFGPPMRLLSFPFLIASEI